MLTIITFSIITVAASAATMVVTARDGYRRVPTRRI